MYMCCQINSVSNAFLPITLGARLATRSGDPPSPIPVMPASVSTRMTMLLWLNDAVMLFRFDPVLGVNARILVTMAFGRPAAARATAGGVRACAAWAQTGLFQGRKRPPSAPAVKVLAKVLRSMVTVPPIPVRRAAG